MAGHSKWSNIKRKKGANDAKRSKLFSKLVREITVAVNLGGSDPEFNPRLRLAIQNAKGVNMPKEPIARAISKGEGGDATTYTEVTYEGYGGHGVAIIVTSMTDKITRTIANVRAAFSKYGGSLEKNGAVAFLFDRKGVFVIPKSSVKDEESLTLALIDAGADDLEQEEGYFHTLCPVEAFGSVQKELEKLNIVPAEANLQYLPHTPLTLTDEALLKVMKLIEVLEDDEDVQKVYHNINIATSSEQEILLN